MQALSHCARPLSIPGLCLHCRGEDRSPHKAFSDCPRFLELPPGEQVQMLSCWHHIPPESCASLLLLQPVCSKAGTCCMQSCQGTSLFLLSADSRLLRPVCAVAMYRWHVQQTLKAVGCAESPWRCVQAAAKPWQLPYLRPPPALVCQFAKSGLCPLHGQQLLWCSSSLSSNACLKQQAHSRQSLHKATPRLLRLCMRNHNACPPCTGMWPTVHRSPSTDVLACKAAHTAFETLVWAQRARLPSAATYRGDAAPAAHHRPEYRASYQLPASLMLQCNA